MAGCKTAAVVFVKAIVPGLAVARRALASSEGTRRGHRVGHPRAHEGQDLRQRTVPSEHDELLVARGRRLRVSTAIAARIRPRVVRSEHRLGPQGVPVSC